MKDLLITINEDKEPYIKKLTDDKVINLTGESGSGKSYYCLKFKDNDDYIVVDTDEVFSRFETSVGINKELGMMFRTKYDKLPDNCEDFLIIYKEILDYFKGFDKTIVIDSAQFRNIKDISILKGTVIVMRTSIDNCFKRCVDRWQKNNPCATDEDLQRYASKKKAIYEWYYSLNEFLVKLDGYNIKNKGIEETRSFYNLDTNVQRYGDAVDKVGLWESEKIIFEKYILKDKKILDIGCGGGRTTINMYKLGYENIIGLDLSDGLINFAKEYCKNNDLNTSFVVGDATALEFEDNTFDVVIFSYNGMQCIPGKINRDKVLHEVYRVLKPGGIYIFTAHNRDDSGSHKQEWTYEEQKWQDGTQDKNLETFGDKYVVDRRDEVTFLHFSNIQEMEEFIKQENFEIIEYIKSSEVAQENEITKEFAGQTVFWVIKKI